VPHFNALILGEPLNSRLRNFVSKNIQTSLYRVVRNVFRYLEVKPFRRGSHMWQTDRRTEWLLAKASSNDAC